MVFVVGLGAAGNKAVIRAIDLEVIKPAHTVLVNSTEKDIPEEYKEKSIIIGNNLKGCGKERTLAKNAMISYLKTTDTFSNIPADTDRVIIVTSVEGGTGSGSSTVLAKFIRDVLGFNTSIIAFTGFENDIKGLTNTIEFMKELDERTTIQLISNKKFLPDANNNHSKAQELANDEFCKRLKIMSGSVFEESDQNMDDRDIYNLIDNNPGLMDITYTDIETPLKNNEQFNKICSAMVDESKSIDFDPTATKLGIIFNGKIESRNAIDHSYKVFKDKYGMPEEVYTQLQENKSYRKEFLACIASGMKLPIDAVQRTYDEYVDRISKVSKGKDDFFETVGGLLVSDENRSADPSRRNATISKDDFFNNF